MPRHQGRFGPQRFDAPLGPLQLYRPADGDDPDERSRRRGMPSSSSPAVRPGASAGPARDGHPYRGLGTFSQSERNFFRPMSVSGCLASCSSTLKGMVAASAPMRAACTTCMGLRTEATSTWVENS